MGVCCSAMDDGMNKDRAKQIGQGDVAGRYGTGSLTSGAYKGAADSGPNGLIGAPQTQKGPPKKMVYAVGMGLVEERQAMQDLSYRQHAISSRNLKPAPTTSPGDFCGECKRNKKAGECICGKTEEEVKEQKKMKRMQSAPNLKGKKKGVYDSLEAENGAAGRAMGKEKVERFHSEGPSPMKKGGSARWGHATAGGPLMSAAVTPRGVTAASKMGGKGLD